MELNKILNADLDDIIFERRHKEYGAYNLRKIYKNHITNAMLITLAFLVLLFAYPYIKQLLSPKDNGKKNLEVVTLTELSAPPPLDKTTPPPPPPDIPPPPKTIKFTPPVVVPDEQVKEEEEVKTIEELKEAPVSTTTNIDPNAEVKFETPVTVVEEAPTKPLMFVEQMPLFPGGEQALQDYLYKNIKYPNAARENGIEGAVVLQFVVNADGSISDIKTLREVGGGCTEEAIRVVRGMPKWAPGKQNGNAVPVYFNLPVTFQLTANE